MEGFDGYEIGCRLDGLSKFAPEQRDARVHNPRGGNVWILHDQNFYYVVLEHPAEFPQPNVQWVVADRFRRVVASSYTMAVRLMTRMVTQ